MEFDRYNKTIVPIIINNNSKKKNFKEDCYNPQTLGYTTVYI